MALRLLSLTSAKHLRSIKYGNLIKIPNRYIFNTSCPTCKNPVIDIYQRVNKISDIKDIQTLTTFVNKFGFNDSFKRDYITLTLNAINKRDCESFRYLIQYIAKQPNLMSFENYNLVFILDNIISYPDITMAKMFEENIDIKKYMPTYSHADLFINHGLAQILHHSQQTNFHFKLRWLGDYYELNHIDYKVDSGVLECVIHLAAKSNNISLLRDIIKSMNKTEFVYKLFRKSFVTIPWTCQRNILHPYIEVNKDNKEKLIDMHVMLSLSKNYDLAKQITL